MFGKAPRLDPPSLVRQQRILPESQTTLAFWTDEALFAKARVRVAFTERTGGQSVGPYASLNLWPHVGDDPAAVRANQQRAMEELGLQGLPLVVPKQVHGDRVVSLAKASARSVEDFRAEAAKGADALLVQDRGVATMMCSADCVLLVMVAPSGRFAIVHAGWRGVENGVAVAALHKLMLGEPGLSVDASCVNVYRGSYIHAECFEVGKDVHELFVERFGSSVAPDTMHIDLGRALDLQLVRAGIDPARIADVGRCTVCDNGRWFSYRAQGGVCGRHGAFCAAV